MKLGKYKHYKGQEYEVIGLALHTETREKLVLYKALYKVDDLDKELGENPIFARPYSMFNEKVKIDNSNIPRFKHIS